MINAEEEQIKLLQKIIDLLGGKEISNQSQQGTYYAYCETTNATYVTDLLDKYCGDNYKQANSLQTGIYEYRFICSPDVYYTIVQAIEQQQLPIQVYQRRLPISGSIGTISVTLNSGTPRTPSETTINLGNSSTTLLEANSKRKGFLIQNLSDVTIYVRESGGTASSTAGIAILPYGQIERAIETGNCTTTKITGITSSGTGKQVNIIEYE